MHAVSKGHLSCKGGRKRTFPKKFSISPGILFLERSPGPYSTLMGKLSETKSILLLADITCGRDRQEKKMQGHIIPIRKPFSPFPSLQVIPQGGCLLPSQTAWLSFPLPLNFWSGACQGYDMGSSVLLVAFYFSPAMSHAGEETTRRRPNENLQKSSTVTAGAWLGG